MVCCVVVACSTRARTADDDRNATSTSQAIVIRSAEMTGTVLQTIRSRIPSVRVLTVTGQCPRIIFRGALSAMNQPPPSIYIDGALTGNTCVLDAISGQEVDRIEVYPSGNTPHAEIRRNASGVILIFHRQE